MPEAPILVINSGSSSLKLGLYTDQGGDEQPFLEAQADGIARPAGKLVLQDGTGKVLHAEDSRLPSQLDALDRIVPLLKQFSSSKPSAVGFRVVHGGPHLTTHQLITPPVLAELKACVHFAPLHIPPALQLIEHAAKIYPHIPQFACFDTAFHRTLPEHAKRFAIPRELFQEGIRRYGFHGLSYESIVHQLRDHLPERLVIAHLGNGASLCAIKKGVSIDTTMGLTPTGGIPMATRSGDLDPGVLIYLMRAKGMDADAIEKMLNRKSGLVALSNGESDMRDLQKSAAAGNPEAQLAMDVFCISIQKVVAAYSAVLGGLDMLVFAGGIGEHSAPVRANVCNGLQFLGISMDAAANQRNSDTISAANSTIRVRVIPAEEDLQIARHCRALLQSL